MVEKEFKYKIFSRIVKLFGYSVDVSFCSKCFVPLKISKRYKNVKLKKGTFDNPTDYTKKDIYERTYCPKCKVFTYYKTIKLKRKPRFPK